MAFLGAMTVVVPSHKATTLHAQLGGEVLLLEVADTDALRIKGLSGHAALHGGEGMLFIFPADDRYGFWMKDMLFPIDTVWLDRDRRIIDVQKEASPASYPEVFLPAAPARYVVEVRAGFFDDHHLETGDILQILR